MTKGERYHNHIVDDMVKKTEIYNDTILCPHYAPYLNIDTFLAQTVRSSFFRFFKNHLQTMYGVKDDEVEMVWDRYREGVEHKWEKTV